MLPDDAIPIATVRSVKAPSRELRLKHVLNEAQLTHLCKVGLDWVWCRGASAAQGKRFRVQAIRLVHEELLVQLAAGVSRDVVAQLRSATVYLEPSPENLAMLDLGQDTPDVVGMRVEHADGRSLGKVTELLETPAHPILCIKASDGRQWMLPCIDVAVLAIDEAAQVITVVDDITPFALASDASD